MPSPTSCSPTAGNRARRAAHRRDAGVFFQRVEFDLSGARLRRNGVAAVTHRDSIDDLVRKGRDLETAVLARALPARVEHRTLVFGNKTIVLS
ncbi:MAG: hypothetical protein ABI775_03410 [Pseudonocardiales bacterium]